VAGLTLGSTAPRLFRALVEATAFGSRAIMERFQREGVRAERVVALGGIAQKSPFVMQVTADVMNVPIQVVASEQACALGAAMFAAVAAGLYAGATEAQEKIGSGFSRTFTPDPAGRLYQGLYRGHRSWGGPWKPLRSL
jgi:L-ribulokinase